MSDTQCRKWLITINNPKEKGYDHERIKAILRSFKKVLYWCMSDEIGIKEQTYHTHIFLVSANGIRFTTMKNRFDGAHFDACNGSCINNRDYVFKNGKWSNTEKEDTRVDGTQEEWGEIPLERQGHRNDLDDLYDMIRSGMTNFEIIESSPQYMLNLDKIERCRQVVQEEKYKNVWRDLQTMYIYGQTGAGKTRSIMELYGYDKVFRVTDYEHPFDGYKGQDVIVFEEFRSSMRKQTEPALIDVDTLTAALYDRFHEDGQVNNMTMVPLGEVIQFIKEMPAIDKESTVESEIESEQDAEYEQERD